MCYSSEASIGAFIFSAILSFILYRRNKNNDRSIAILIFGISTMQIAEFIMHMDPKCKSDINILCKLYGPFFASNRCFYGILQQRSSCHWTHPTWYRRNP